MRSKYLPSSNSSTIKRPLASKPVPTISNDSITNQNSRIQSIRQKYSSKEKSNTNLFTLRRDDNSNENTKVKEHTKQPLKETTSYHIRTNTEGSLEGERRGRHVLGKDINRDNINEILNRSTSKEYLELKERQQKSKQKVNERLDNISKIRDKINNLITKYDIGNTKPTNILDSRINRTDFNSSLGRKGVIKKNNLTQDRDFLNTSLTDSIKQYNLNEHTRSRDSRSSSSSNLHSHSFLLQRQSLRKLQQNYSTNIHSESDWVKADEPIYHIQRFSSTLPHPSFSIKSSKRSESSLRNSTQSTNLANNSQSQISHLISSLLTQIDYDQQYRISKYLFHLNHNPHKYSKLLSQLQRRGIPSSLSQLKSQMKFYQDEYDPFIQQQTHEDYQRYADAIIAAARNWVEKVERKFSYWKLWDEGVGKSLRCEGGRVEVADLVRFVNLNSGRLFKNRDLVIVMRRIGDGEGRGREEVEIGDMWRVLCKDYE